MSAVCEFCGSAACLAMNPDVCHHTRHPRRAQPKAVESPPDKMYRRGRGSAAKTRDTNGRLQPRKDSAFGGGTTA